MLRQIKRIVKERILRRLGIPFNRYGLPNPLLKHLQKRDIVLVDVGAHNGDFTAQIDAYCGISKGVLIEVLPDKVAYLQTRFAASKYSVINCAASSNSSLIEFEINEATATSSMLRIKREMHELSNIKLGKSRIIQCQARTLDDIAQEMNWEHIDLLKLDVQGAEHLVLDGATSVLNKTSMVWTEVSFKPLYEGSSDFCYLYHQFYEKGFELMELESDFRAPDGELLQCNALFINERMLK